MNTQTSVGLADPEGVGEQHEAADDAQHHEHGEHAPARRAATGALAGAGRTCAVSKR